VEGNSVLGASLPSAEPAPRLSPIRVLRNPSFFRLYAAAAASQLGAAIFVVSVAWVVYHRTGSALDITYVGVASVIPGVALGLFAGVWADRYNRRTMMILSDSVRAVTLTVLTVYLASVGFSLFVTLAGVVVVYGFTATFNPASSAILPRMMPTTDLEDANGLLVATGQGTQVIGAAAGGLIIAFSGVVPGFAVNALTYLLSAVFLTQIASSIGAIARAPATTSDRRPFVSDLREGMRYIRDQPSLLQVVLGPMPVNFLASMVFSFLVVYNAQILTNNTSEYAFLVAGISAGIAIGAVAVGRLGARRYAGPLIAVGVVVCGAAVIALAVSHVFWVSLALDVAIGVVIGLINTAYAATMQTIVPNAVLGRVLSVELVAGSLATPVGIVLGGLLITARSVEFDYLIAGVALIANGLVLTSMKGIRNFRAP
jgi:MFS family permease